MKKLNGLTGIINAIKLVLKYAAYVSIVIEIANFAIERLTPFLSSDEKKQDLENAEGQPTNN